MPVKQSVLVSLSILGWLAALPAQGEGEGPGVLPPPQAEMLILPMPAPSPGPLSEEHLGPSIESPSQGSTNSSTDVVQEFVPTPVYEWYQPAYWFGPAPWDVGLQFGLNGSEGTNSTQSIQVGSHMKRKTKFWKYDSNLSYNRNSSNGFETQNNAQFEARLDRRLDESPWSLFFLNQTQYDEFQAFDLRLALNSGLGYEFYDTETYAFSTRFGAGSSREFGGPDTDWAWEALFGFDTEWQISSTQRFTGKVDYFPEWGDFGDYRIVSDAGWEIDLDKPANMSLKFSVNDRYDSTPNGAPPNLVNYAVLLIWRL